MAEIRTNEEILKDEQFNVAQKYKLGSTLVIGHKPVYYNEASLEAMKLSNEQFLKGFAEWINENVLWARGCMVYKNEIKDSDQLVTIYFESINNKK